MAFVDFSGNVDFAIANYGLGLSLLCSFGAIEIVFAYQILEPNPNSGMQNLARLLSNLNISFECVSHAESKTIAEYSDIVQKTVSEGLAVKTILLSNKTVLVACATRRIALDQLGKHLGAKLRILDAATILSLASIDMHPFAAHSKSPFLLSPMESSYPLLIDSDLLDSKKIVFRAFSGLESISIHVAQLKVFLESNENQIINFKDLSAAKAEKSPSGILKIEKAAVKEKAELLGVTATKNGDFSNWYSQVLLRTEMMDYYDISGCYIIRPWAYSIWKHIQGLLKN